MLNIKDISDEKLKENCPEQRMAILAAQKGDIIAMERLIQTNRALVMSRLQHYGYKPNDNDFEDLLQEGTIGLINAINKFDLSFKRAFSTYAVGYIDSCLKRCKKCTTEVHVPENKHYEILRYKNTYEELKMILGRKPIEEEIADALNVTIDTIIMYQQVIKMNETVSLQSDNGIGDDVSIIDYIDSEGEINSNSHPLETMAEKNNLNDIILELLFNSNLSDSEIIILLLNFGFKNLFDRDCLLQEIGNMFGITRQAVKIQEELALAKLFDNPGVLNLLQYSQNPDLVLRKYKIKKRIRKKPFSEKYPNFNSFFPEYSDSEIAEASLCLTESSKKFLEKLSTAEYGKGNINKYIKSDAEKLFRIISIMYNELLEKFGRRKPLDYDEEEYNAGSISVINDKMNQEKLRKIFNVIDVMAENPIPDDEHSFYDYFVGFNKDLVDKSLFYIAQEHYEYLQKKYGTDLKLKFNNKANKPSLKDKLLMKVIIGQIRKMVSKLQEGEQLFSNIYVYFNKYSTELIDGALQELSERDKTILYKRFGKNLKEPLLESNLTRLNIKEQARLTLIIKKLEDKLPLLQANRIIGTKINRPINPYIRFNEYSDNIMTYIISKLSLHNRKILINIFGKNLKTSFIEKENINFGIEDVNYYNYTIIQAIKRYIIKIGERGIKKIIESEQKKVNIPSLMINDGLTGIYRIFANVSIKELNKVFENLFDQEIEIIKKVFGEDFKDNQYDKKIKVLTNDELLAFYGVINKIKNMLEKNEVELSIGEYNDILRFVNNSYSVDSEPTVLRNNMILFLALGVGGVEPVSISIIAKTFNLSLSEVKSIISSSLKEYIVPEELPVNKFIKNSFIPDKREIYIRNNMILFMSLGIGGHKAVPRHKIAKMFGLTNTQINAITKKQLTSYINNMITLKSSFNKLISCIDENTSEDGPIIGVTINRVRK